MSTSHAYGCEFPACPKRGQRCQEWLPGFGYQTAFYCPDHMPSMGEPVGSDGE